MLPEYVDIQDHDRAILDYQMLRLFEWHVPLVAGGIDEQPERRLHDAVLIASLVEKIKQQAKNNKWQ